jgi:hypothetical protein
MHGSTDDAEARGGATQALEGSGHIKICRGIEEQDLLAWSNVAQTDYFAAGYVHMNVGLAAMINVLEVFRAQMDMFVGASLYAQVSGF